MLGLVNSNTSLGLWAYRRVNDIELLEEIAVAKNIIWEKGSIFEKTEITSPAMQEETQRLRKASEEKCLQHRLNTDYLEY